MPFIDFSGVTMGRVLLPPGEYDLILEKITQRQSKAGNTMWNCQFKLAEEIEGLNAARVFHGCTFTVDSAWNIKRTLFALGIDGEELNGGLREADILALFNSRLSAVVRAKVGLSNYQGNTSNKIEAFQLGGEWI